MSIVHFFRNYYNRSRVSSKQSNFYFGSNRNKPKLNLFRLFFGLFHETKKQFFAVYFGLFRCFGSVSKQPKQTELCRNKPKQTETNQKISKKRSLWGSRNSNFFSRLEPKQTETQSVSVVIRFFSRKPKLFFQFVSVFRTGIETTETNRTYGLGNLKGWYFNKFAAVSVGLLFVSVVSKHRNSLFQY